MPEKDKINVAVIVGNHPYDVVDFQRAFRSVDNAECYVQHMEQFTSSPKEWRQWYDVVVFYNMHTEIPKDGDWVCGDAKTALEELGETKQGIFILHHAILAYREWELWSEICGIDDRGFGYYVNQTVELNIKDKTHPITAGLSDFTLNDETYTMKNAGEGSHILIAANHPKSMETMAWVRQYKASPVFCYASGHDKATFGNESFRKILKQAIEWLSKGKRGE